MLTNFTTIRKAVRKMSTLDKLMASNNFDNLSKRERLQIERERAKLEKNLGSISDLNRLPSAVFIVDLCKEHIALAEAKKLNIPTFGIVDTNANPLSVDFAIPANDDAAKSIEIIVKIMVEAIAEGLNERRMERESRNEPEEAVEEDSDENETEDSRNFSFDEEEDDESERKVRKAPRKRVNK